MERILGLCLKNATLIQEYSPGVKPKSPVADSTPPIIVTLEVFTEGKYHFQVNRSILFLVASLVIQKFHKATHLFLY